MINYQTFYEINCIFYMNDLEFLLIQYAYVTNSILLLLLKKQNNKHEL
jgi:hypothetical protein